MNYQLIWHSIPSLWRLTQICSFLQWPWTTKDSARFAKKSVKTFKIIIITKMFPVHDSRLYLQAQRSIITDLHNKQIQKHYDRTSVNIAFDFDHTPMLAGCLALETKK